jgi:hypothetical protein
MIVSTNQYTVSSTPVKVVSTGEVVRNVWINCSSNDDFYIGPNNTVSTTTGFFVAKTAADFQIELDANDEIWAVVATGTHTITVMQVSL